MKKSPLVKIGVAIVAIGIFALLFMRSLQDTRSAAYTVANAHLQGASIAIEAGTRANDPLLVVRPSPDLAAGLFKQVFARAMESLNSPASPSIPVVLRGEYDRVVGDQMTQDALRAAAVAAGLHTAALTPRCLIHLRVSEPGGVRQAFVLLFDAPAITNFRRQLGLDADALSPVMFVAGAGDFSIWLPLKADAATDCLAPVEIAS